MNPFEFSCPIKTQCTEPKISNISFIVPVLILMVVGFMMLAVSIESTSFIENNPYDIIEVQKVMNNSEPSEYKKEKTPRDGTVRLVKGEATVVHHNIKKDSTIMLSRKNIEGKVGVTLVVDEIIPNESFKVRSLNLDTVLEDKDYGEIYFLVL